MGSLVCGYSDGGQIALGMGLNYPRLAKAYVVGGADYRWSAEWLNFAKELGLDSPGTVDPERAERNKPDIVNLVRERQDAYQGEGYWKTYLRQASFMWLAPMNYSVEDLRKIVDPSLILAGDRDDWFIPIEDAVHLYRSIPGSELAVAPGCTHSLPFKNPAMLTNLALDFLLRHKSDPT